MTERIMQETVEFSEFSPIKDEDLFESISESIQAWIVGATVQPSVRDTRTKNFVPTLKDKQCS